MAVELICDNCNNKVVHGFWIAIQAVENNHPSGKCGSIYLSSDPSLLITEGSKQIFICQDCFAESRLPNPYDEDSVALKNKYEDLKEAYSKLEKSVSEKK